MVAEMMLITQESAWDTGATNGSHVGLAQQDPRYWPATRNPEKDTLATINALIKNDKANPSYKLQDLVESVQRSGQPEEYGQWEKEAKHIVDEYGGGAEGSVTHQYYEPFQFTVGQPDGPKGENFWQAALRLAAKVRWRFFVVGNFIYYMSDDDLLKSKPVMIIDDNDPGIENIDGDLMDDGKPATELTIECRMDAWDGDPGEVVQLKSTMGPGAGRWLIWTIHQPFFTDKTTITIKRPQKALKEPAPTLTSSSRDAGRIYSGGTVDGDGLRDKIVNAAELALSSKYHYHYLQSRPMPRSLFSKEAQAGIDCSAFVTLVYKAAGADDPNGFAYNGTGNTTTLMSHGKKTGTYSRGDLVFYRSPEHVGVYIGDGMVIEMGGDPGPRKVPINYRNDMIGVYTYNLDPNNHPALYLQEHLRTGK
jgi:cell wall-associated NlpC family hydrolase